MKLSPVILGTMWPDTASAPLSDLRCRVDAAISLGVTSIDTAPLYDFGLVEEQLGAILAGRRDQVQILGKAGLRWDDEHGEIHFTMDLPGGGQRVVRRNSQPESLRHETEQILSRLKTDHLDLLQLHFPDPHTPIPESMAALQQLHAEGKIRAIGVSNYLPEQVAEARRALGEVPLFSNQIEFNLLSRDAEEELIPRQHALGVATLCYSPLAQGLLTRPLREGYKEPPGSRFAAATARACRQHLAPIAAELDCSPAQVCLAWLLAQPGVRGVIAGARSEDQARDIAAAAQLRLRSDHCDRLGQAFAGLGAHQDLGPLQRLRHCIRAPIRRLVRRRRVRRDSD